MLHRVRKILDKNVTMLVPVKCQLQRVGVAILIPGKIVEITIVRIIEILIIDLLNI